MIKSRIIMGSRNRFLRDKIETKELSFGRTSIEQKFRGSHCLNKEMIFHAVGK